MDETKKAISLGNVSFRIGRRDDLSVDPKSRRALQIATRIEMQFNFLVLWSAEYPELRQHRISAKVERIGTGSLIVTLGVRAVIVGKNIIPTVKEHETELLALYTFIKDYPKIKEGILALARNIKEVSVKTFFFFTKLMGVEVEGLDASDRELRELAAEVERQLEAARAAEVARAEVEAVHAANEATKNNSQGISEGLMHNEIGQGVPGPSNQFGGEARGIKRALGRIPLRRK